MSTRQTRYDEEFKRTLVDLYHNGKSDTKKSNCHLHASLEQRLDAVHKLRNQHNIKTLCKVLHVNRSTYYKHFYSEPAPRTNINQQIKVDILQIYTDYDKSIGAYKIRRVLERDYGIAISVGNVLSIFFSTQAAVLSILPFHSVKDSINVM